jgi:RNA polymerase sigma-70 factor (ECF subfamily)
MAEPSERNLLQGDPRFAQTQWSLVMKAAGQDSSAGPALEKLCRAYWYPLYAFVRRTGLSPHDAEDATQGFFMHLIGNRALETVDQQRGTFRNFMLASLKNFMSHQRERAGAQKRGGGQLPVALDAHSAEERYALEPQDSLSPDRLYDRRWALTLLERTQQRLRHEYQAAGKGELFAALRPTLTGSRDTPYQEIAAQLEMTEGSVKTAVHRLRDRYRSILRAEVADTVADLADVEDELRFLIESL